MIKFNVNDHVLVKWIKSTEESRRELIDTMIVLQDVADLAELEALKQKGK